MKLKFLFLFLFVAFIAAACVQGPPTNQQQQTGNTTQNNNSGGGNSTNAGGKVKVGFAMATLKEARWVRDREAFEAHCKKTNIECVVTVADGKADKQANDVDNLLTQGVNVIVIAPHDATQAASMVEKAKAQGVPVISYDRLINSDKIDLYVS